MGGYLTNSALLMGCAELLVLSALMGQTQAAAILRTAFIVLLVLNVIPLGLLFANLRPAHALLYTREQQWRVGMLIAAGTLIPLGLMLLKGGLPFLVAAVIFLLSRVGSSVLCTSRYLTHRHWKPEAANSPILTLSRLTWLAPGEQSRRSTRARGAQSRLTLTI